MKKLLIAISSLLILVACERTVEEPDWPEHEEKLVVTAFLRLERDSIFAYARVNRTLPLGDRFDLAKVMVNDADVRMENGDRSFPINKVLGFYPFDFDFNYSAVTMRGSDDNFALTVKQGGKTASAAFRVIPVATRFTTLRVERSAQADADYLATYQIPASGPETEIECLVEFWYEIYYGWQQMYSIKLPNQANRPDGMLEGSFPFWTFGWQGTKQRIRYTLIARNHAYEDYLNSRWGYGTSGDSPFDPPRKNPPFNVSGDGIGFFWYEIVGEPVEIEY